MVSVKWNKVLDDNVQLATANAVGSEVQIIDYKLRPYTKEKEGYVAVHYALTVNYKLSNDTQVQVYNFFLKAAHSLDFENPEKSVFDDISPFPREVNFFNKIVPTMLEYLKGETFTPKCWLATKEMLFFEDLGLIGYATPKSKLQDVESLKCLASALAKFHAASIMAEAKFGKPLNQLDPSVFEDVMFHESEKEDFGLLYATLKLVADLAKQFGFNCPDMDKINKFLIDTAKPSPNGFNVINHGDLWKNNYLLNGDKPDKCILVDYQCLRYTTPVIDLMMMMNINATSETRKAHERDLIEHYHSAFCTTLEQCDTNLRVPKFEELWQTYEEHKLFGVAFAAMYIPGLLMPEEDLNKILTNTEDFKRYAFENRSEFIIPQLNKNPNYAEAIKEIVREFVEVAT